MKYKIGKKAINPLKNIHSLCQESQERKSSLRKQNYSVPEKMEIGEIKKTQAENSGNGNAIYVNGNYR